MQKNLKRILAALLVACFTLLAIASSSEEDKDPVATNPEGGVSTAQGKTTAETTVETVKVKAEDLLEAFEANQVNAENQYKGKTLEITGTVDSISKDIMDDTYISLTGKGDFSWSVQCYLTKESIDAAANVKKGDTLTICGEYSSFSLNVIVKRCVIKK